MPQWLRRAFPAVVVFTLLALQSSCTASPEFVRKMTPEAALATGDGVLRAYYAGDVATLSASLSEGWDAATREQLAAHSAAAAGRVIERVEVIGFQQRADLALGRHTVLVHQVFFEGGTVEQFELRLVPRQDGTLGLQWLNLVPLEMSHQQRYALANARPGLVHAVFVLIALATLAVTLAAVTVAWARASRWGRLGWTLLALVGSGQWALDWTAGEWSFSLLTVGLPVLGFSQQSVAVAWSLAGYLPVGAIVVLLVLMLRGRRPAAPPPGLAAAP
jgi:hypothetical protein